MTHVFIVGSKGIPAKYGGFETFVERLTAGKVSENIQYHVSCMNNDERHFEHNGADCFNVRLPLPGAPGRIFHVGLVLKYVEVWAKEHKGEATIVYILGCRIGPLLIPHSRKLHRLGVKIYCNPDGLEWKRDKWNRLAKRFLKYCERCLVVNSDLVICDSKNIESYIKDTYGKKVIGTTFIAYGAEETVNDCGYDEYINWCKNKNVKPSEYYLIVGRFVPENNYESMISGFMKSNTKKDLVIITNVERNKFYSKLLNATHFDSDKRIKFVGTVYDSEILGKIREYAYGYIHGHEVGGTNPSLLEALASTKLNLLLDVGFNREVADKTALYWSKEQNNLSKLINECDEFDEETINQYGIVAKERIREAYNWKSICSNYERIFSE